MEVLIFNEKHGRRVFVLQKEGDKEKAALFVLGDRVTYDLYDKQAMKTALRILEKKCGQGALAFLLTRARFVNESFDILDAEAV